MATEDFENYTSTSKSYDETRIPLGIEVVLGCLAAFDPRSASEHVVLDAGCGTGNYLQALAGKVARRVGIDVNQGMLGVARAKLGGGKDVELVHGSMYEMPFPDGQFDAVMYNQVLHHVVRPMSEGGVTDLGALFRECFRVVRPGGVVVVNTCSHQQLQDGYWWAPLVQPAVRQMTARMPSIDDVIDTLTAAGFRMAGVMAPLYEILQGPTYSDTTGPLRASFRAGDSTWSLLSPEELEACLTRIRRMHEDGSIASFFEEREQRRKAVGQTTFLYATKGG